MLKKKLLLSVGLGLLCSVAVMEALAWPQPTANYTHVIVDNNLGIQVVTAITAMNNGTVMDSNPNPIGPGQATFQNEGTSWYPAGFTLAIGDASHPLGQCIVKLSLLDQSVIQAGDGSDGFVCHSVADHVVLDPVSRK